VCAVRQTEARRTVTNNQETILEKSSDVPFDEIRSRHRRNKYNFQDLSVGDSYLLKSDDPMEIQSARSAVSHFGRRYERKFATRIVENGFLRIWRLE